MNENIKWMFFDGILFSIARAITVLQFAWATTEGNCSGLWCFDRRLLVSFSILNAYNFSLSSSQLEYNTMVSVFECFYSLRIS